MHEEMPYIDIGLFSSNSLIPLLKRNVIGAASQNKVIVTHKNNRIMFGLHSLSVMESKM